MATNYDGRLQKLKVRRQGDAPYSIFAMDSLSKADSVYRPVIEERYEKRSSSKATRYALGTMQEVDPDYTTISYAQGDRVKNQLKNGLKDLIPVTFEYQGSVPLNVHIKSVSDVDLLVLLDNFITVNLDGAKNKAGHYTSWHGDSGLKLLKNLRNQSTEILKNAFPEVNVDILGSKSIALSGGSLRRKIDVVPSHWHDTIDYQTSYEKKDRGVSILDTSVNAIVSNLPFLHMHYISAKDISTNGGAKKTIRMLKNLKADSDHSSSISLSSYDIASLVWHFDTALLFVQPWNELSLLASAESQLRYLVVNKIHTMSLRTPDNTRCVIDSEGRFNAMVLLYSEVRDLAAEVAREISGNQSLSEGDVFDLLKKSFISLNT